MFNEESVDSILQGIVWLNEKMGIWSIIIPVIFALLVIIQLYINYKSPSTNKTKIFLATFAFIYLYSGYTIYIGKEFMGLTMALVGAFALWFVTIFLILDIIFNWTYISFNKKSYLTIISFLLIFIGIIIYPIVEMILGFTYPRMVFFGAECPTTIALIGLLVGGIPKTNKPLLIILSLNAIITGGSIALSGAYFDWLYALAGIIGIIVMTMNFKKLFLVKKGKAL